MPDLTILVDSKYSFSKNVISIGNNDINEIQIQDINEIKRILNLPKIKSKEEYFRKILLNLNEENPESLNILLCKKK